MPTTLTWRDVFDTTKKCWGMIHLAARAAHQAGYHYMAWNGRVLAVEHKEREGYTTTDTGVLAEALG